MGTCIYKEEALAAYGGSTARLAEALGTTYWAVYRWPTGHPIPERRALKLRYELRPDLFNADHPTVKPVGQRKRSTIKKAT